MQGQRFFIVGGAGFIGSHFTDTLLSDKETKAVTIYDNFSSGREWHYEHHASDSRLHVIRGDVKDFEKLKSSMTGHDTVIHLASNPDIAKAATEPDIDFREGTSLTANVVEAARVNKVKQILYASGSGIYGDIGHTEAQEDYGPLIPISTYGASKLAGEALISSYSYMFGLRACVFRFGNVVGPRQTHGVGFDFLRQLLEHPGYLQILGDGTQSKSYIHVSDIIQAVLLAARQAPSMFNAFNVATGDYVTVKEIAVLAIECAGLNPKETDLKFTGGDRGWKGDVPIVRLNTDRIQKLGWKCSLPTREALKKSMMSMLKDAQSGRLYNIPQNNQ